MNKKFFTLLAVLGLAISSFTMAQSDIVKGDYYHLETQTVGTTTTSALNLVLTEETTDGKAALVAMTTASTLATSDSALWKVDYTLDVTSGEYSYVFKNKATGAQLSFAAGSNALTDATLVINTDDYDDNPVTGVKDNATLSGSLNFNWGSPLAAGVPTTAAVLTSYIPTKDSTLSLAVKFDGGIATAADTKYPIIQVMTEGNAKPTAGATTEKNAILAVKPVRATAKKLTGTELNNMLGTGRGFQLFFSYKNKLTTANNALAGVIFEAVNDEDGVAATTGSDVLLKAKTLTPKKSGTNVTKSLYAYVDTICYDAANPTADGTKLTFKVDTLPTTDGSVGTSNGLLTKAAYTFNFYSDPSSANDSVAVFVTASYDVAGAGATPPRTWANKTASVGAFPLQIAPLAGISTDKLVLTTGADQVAATALPEETRISFTGGAAPAPLFDATKVYSVKNVNEEAGDEHAGKYMVVAPISAIAYGEAYSSKVFAHLPSTQFVFDGAKMINRELNTVSTDALYSVEGKDDVYTNLADTFEIKAMEDVNLKDSTMGWSYITADSLTNYAFSLDYVSGILEGRSINMKADSAVVATTEEGKLFKLEAVGFGKVTDAAEVDGVKTLYNQAYKIYTKDKKFVVVKNGSTGKLALTSVTSAAGAAAADAFFLKETENKGEYILVNGASKYNVNSTTEALEAVGLNLNNNAFAVQVEKAPEYVLDAKGHYNIENLRGDMLAADAQGFGMFRKEGELKADYVATDFALYVDTAKIHATQPSYFILSGAKAGEGSELEGNFLRVMTDSVTANVEGYKAANGMTRLAFVPAKREATSDSLLVNYQKETFVKGDSVGYKGKQAGIEQFQFKIQYTETDGQYIIENAAGYLATYNDVLCLSPKSDGIEKSQLIKLTTTSAPTANEGVEVSEVKVIAGNGNVQIIGAAGKKVVITNILGQTVANTVITSSDATIAAPAGVVVVAIEGEDAVKAIVK
ncbi:hypothetical protein DWW90_11760 [Parabacteroides sp. AF17-28]|uniref:DUF6383 domain-containing protein n=1 Tax=Parabacteroides sp. AF17-28 TaxID=2292241 RepID=UPI000F00EBC1|nr:DUF6383 domain-containing protein [Parabacteroides sp. AF17-28]RHR57001.1 hypothetical protein DWW90_11760 [Parabacteroides sp. AF17-28]